ncbi:hypothetical protein EGR_05148 [Echinococcus granulosus]|uniref:Uncharacterized protein n=1 Tax=Echinococcus granulosus TaxID=6210 RepID=W6UNV5_ECHGR|nr:hypothetical protein EGR_05148 [Echinococcus granulosus]EUB59987.1 hypothetical protein EGR_05148 [Echinococcus granulosus]
MTLLKGYGYSGSSDWERTTFHESINETFATLTSHILSTAPAIQWSSPQQYFGTIISSGLILEFFVMNLVLIIVAKAPAWLSDYFASGQTPVFDVSRHIAAWPDPRNTHPVSQLQVWSLLHCTTINFSSVATIARQTK